MGVLFIFIHAIMDILFIIAIIYLIKVILRGKSYYCNNAKSKQKNSSKKIICRMILFFAIFISFTCTTIDDGSYGCRNCGSRLRIIKVLLYGKINIYENAKTFPSITSKILGKCKTCLKNKANNNIDIVGGTGYLFFPISTAYLHYDAFQNHQPISYIIDIEDDEVVNFYKQNIKKYPTLKDEFYNYLNNDRPSESQKKYVENFLQDFLNYYIKKYPDKINSKD